MWLSGRILAHPPLRTGRLTWLFRSVSLLLLGSATAARAVTPLASPNEETGGVFGQAVAGIPAANPDGSGNVIMGAPMENPGLSPTDAGRAYVQHGPSATLLLSLSSPNPEAGGFFGISVGGVPDANGDGLGDVAVGADHEDPGASSVDAGRAYLFDATTGGLLRTLRSPNEEAGGIFGRAVSGIPDVNGDGFGDVIVGAPQENPDLSPTDAGRAYIFSGATGVLLRTLTSPSEETGGQFGFSVAGIPDVNLDGRGDVIVGAWLENPGLSPVDAGRAYVFSGATGALLRSLRSPNEETGGQFGFSVAGLADLDGDSRGDVIVGARFENPGLSPIDAGRAHVFNAASGGLIRTLRSPNEEAGGWFGFAVAGIPDMDGDCREEILIGAPQENPGASPVDAGRAHIFNGATGLLMQTLISPNEETGGKFGSAVTGVRDFNFDGRGDMLVGAPMEDPFASPVDAGRAYLFPSVGGIMGACSVDNWKRYP